ncbi:MAG TPA: glycosyltransferase [Candidatus Latescibacteria bacterium]|jgi:glycosyltransferase involved in cell wall biosynthesis|nr:glycosyltransferase [Candidatus Latescibacterota bacterium]HJP32975.1 glycosyltransferase [Candidatus Latescibacterota bacterium]
MDLSLLIPAYNEEARILETVDSVRQFLVTRSWTHEILVIDDGSADGTADAVEGGMSSRPGLRCIRADANRGKGAAIRLGLEAATGDVVGFIDADDKTDIAALDEVFSKLERGADIVIGDRTLAGSDIAVARRAYRQWGSDQFRRVLRRWLGLGDFPDTQCGFKFFRAPVMRDLFARMLIDGYMFDVELLLLATRSGHRVERIAVHWRDDPDSRFHPVSGTLRNFRELSRIRRYHR